MRKRCFDEVRRIPRNADLLSPGEFRCWGWLSWYQLLSEIPALEQICQHLVNIFRLKEEACSFFCILEQEHAFSRIPVVWLLTRR